MPWRILCPTCNSLLDVDDNVCSLPNAEFKIINRKFCETCGRDLTATLKNATVAISEIIAERNKK